MFYRLLFALLLFTQLSVATTPPPLERESYSRSINIMASHVMGWYSYLLQTQPHSEATIPPHWQHYRHLYPNNIKAIEITGTDLINDKNQQQKQFIVTINLRFLQKNKTVTQQLKDIFEFKNDKLIAITQQTLSTHQVTIEQQYNSDYYQYRNVAYTWLAYLDGANLTVQQLNHIKNAHYQLKIGANKWSDSVKNIIDKRKQYLHTGGHTLHSVKLNQQKSNNKLTAIDLIIYWQGVDKNGMPVVAKIKQTLFYKVNNKQQWQLKKIEEKHVLPDNKPWMGFLC